MTAAPSSLVATPPSTLPSARWSLPELAFWALPVIAYFAFPDRLALGAQILTAAIAVVALDLVLGFAGIVSLGHAAFFGIGAYAAGLLAVRGWAEPFTGLLAGAVAAGLVGGLASFVVVRGQDLTRLMVTLGIGLMVYEAANKASALTGGTDGLSGIETAPVFGVFAFDLEGKTAYWWALGVLIVVFALVKRLAASPFGLSLRGIRDGVKRMPALGVSVDRRLQAAFTVSAALAGVAGAVMAETTQFVGVDALSVPRAAEFLIMLVLGGIGRLYGAVIGAAVFMIAHDVLSDVDPVYWQFWMGILLMTVVLVGRGGVMGLVDRLAARISRKGGASA